MLVKSLLPETVDVLVRFAEVTDESADVQRGELSSVVAIFVDVSDIDLDGSLIVGGDKSVSGRAAREGLRQCG